MTCYVSTAPALACARPKATDKKATRFIQKCQKSLKLQQHFSRFQLTQSAPPFEVIGTNTGRSATYDFLLVIMETMGLPRTVSVIKSDDCNILHVRVFNVPRWGPCGILLRQWAQKNRMMPLSDRQKKFDDMLNHLEAVRQTDLP